jgi:hypothetical protein
MARRKKAAAINQEGPPEVSLTIRPLIDVREDTPQYYTNHIELSMTPHEFCLSAGRMPSRLRPDEIAEAQQSGIVKVPADVQILFPTTLVAGLLRVLSVQKDLYEKQFGVELKDSASAPQSE